MAGNRYYYETTQEVLESYEWLFKEHLTAMDRMARSMRNELQALRMTDKDIKPILQQFFAEVWEQVARTEEQKIQRERKVKSGCGLSALTQAQKQA
ncbi:hypothetical protein D3P07_11430 [Paenibacillus sp. 1011MAR3C5]|uniref:hypothetical protein n=1 Tax=Paenibacillus sp. 1011MAR3C5 TaxID=1675787 RepID=UPI000E6CDED1|nr:hypothetical protein [Paenibacillus sp. 1011MAR3C5]RJE88599.1 hypothetical protein D3P07_11430 [Paenibacillus sp. 1011MAR3C5]